ncbi:hypothetical protein SLEP1_g2156 [Rubroshorea leprosula]|uniref:UNC93-like protein 1 n=1 Tax=Rubroshorea leprosula TaxID=152421 RepID=A0AAV5HRK7_9ROSI|nr:hypothetical protein SLEP1_g2156 [Rubroshorea leprosula]
MGFEGNKEARVVADRVPGGSSLFRYNSPLVQVILIGLVCFCCPSMFNALSGMGGGGQVEPTVANNVNTAPYVTFSIFGVLSGGAYNIFGPRITLALGCSTYILYAVSFHYYNHCHNQAFAIVAGAILGAGTGLLWAGEGAIMTSYPSTARTGSYIFLFWNIFNLGGIIGRLIPFVLNYHRTKAESVNDATYIVFMCFMSTIALLSFSILHPSRVIRNDGTRCTNVKYSNVSTEAVEILKLFRNWKMLLRTRGLYNVLYWGAQMIGSIGLGQVLEFSFESRRRRGSVGISPVALLGTAIWGGDLADHLVYWVNGALAEDSETLSRYTGFYKGVQSARSAVAWQVDKNKVPLLNWLIVNWSLTTVSYPLLAVLVILAVKDENKSAADNPRLPSAPPLPNGSHNERGKST